MAYKILHEKDACIGCGACVAACEKFWGFKEGKSNLKGAKKVGINFELEVEKLDCIKDSAEVCPVNCIHIIDLKTGKKVI
ncbi:MAG: ferredoxin [Candidatus Aenigmatarchaeota archaeon]